MLNPYLKAVYAFFAAGLGSAVTALTDGHISSTEWATIALTAVLATGAVLGVTNIPNNPTLPAPVQPTQ